MAESWRKARYVCRQITSRDVISTREVTFFAESNLFLVNILFIFIPYFIKLKIKYNLKAIIYRRVCIFLIEK